MKRIVGFGLAVATALVVGGQVTPAQAATKVPSKLRHSWYQHFKGAKDPEFIKLTASSIDSGSKAYHHKIKGKALKVKKHKGGWVEIGKKGITNPYYKTKKMKISGKKRTVLLKWMNPSYRYVYVYVSGAKTILPYNKAELNLK